MRRLPAETPLIRLVGKRPMGGGENWAGAQFSREEAREWVLRGNAYGIVVSASPIYVLDVDVKDGGQGMQSLMALQNQVVIKTALDTTLRVRTPSGGLHYYWAAAPAADTLAIHAAPYPDVELFGRPTSPRFVVGAGSPGYQLENGDVPLANVPVAGLEAAQWERRAHIPVTSEASSAGMALPRFTEEVIGDDGCQLIREYVAALPTSTHPNGGWPYEEYRNRLFECKDLAAEAAHTFEQTGRVFDWAHAYTVFAQAVAEKLPHYHMTAQGREDDVNIWNAARAAGSEGRSWRSAVSGAFHIREKLNAAHPDYRDPQNHLRDHAATLNRVLLRVGGPDSSTHLVLRVLAGLAYRASIEEKFDPLAIASEIERVRRGFGAGLVTLTAELYLEHALLAMDYPTIAPIDDAPVDAIQWLSGALTFGLSGVGGPPVRKIFNDCILLPCAPREFRVWLHDIVNCAIKDMGAKSKKAEAVALACPTAWRYRLAPHTAEEDLGIVCWKTAAMRGLIGLPIDGEYYIFHVATRRYYKLQSDKAGLHLGGLPERLQTELNALMVELRPLIGSAAGAGKDPVGVRMADAIKKLTVGTYRDVDLGFFQTVRRDHASASSGTLAQLLTDPFTMRIHEVESNDERVRRALLEGGSTRETSGFIDGAQEVLRFGEGGATRMSDDVFTIDTPIFVAKGSLAPKSLDEIVAGLYSNLSPNASLLLEHLCGGGTEQDAQDMRIRLLVFFMHAMLPSHFGGRVTVLRGGAAVGKSTLVEFIGGLLTASETRYHINMVSNKDLARDAFFDPTNAVLHHYADAQDSKTSRGVSTLSTAFTTMFNVASAKDIVRKEIKNHMATNGYNVATLLVDTNMAFPQLPSTPERYSGLTFTIDVAAAAFARRTFPIILKQAVPFGDRAPAGLFSPGERRDGSTLPPYTAALRFNDATVVYGAVVALAKLMSAPDRDEDRARLQAVWASDQRVVAAACTTEADVAYHLLCKTSDIFEDTAAQPMPVTVGALAPTYLWHPTHGEFDPATPMPEGLTPLVDVVGEMLKCAGKKSTERVKLGTDTYHETRNLIAAIQRGAGPIYLDEQGYVRGLATVRDDSPQDTSAAIAPAFSANIPASTVHA